MAACPQCKYNSGQYKYDVCHINVHGDTSDVDKLYDCNRLYHKFNGCDRQIVNLCLCVVCDKLINNINSEGRTSNEAVIGCTML